MSRDAADAHAEADDGTTPALDLDDAVVALMDEHVASITTFLASRDEPVDKGLTATPASPHASARRFAEALAQLSEYCGRHPRHRLRARLGTFLD